MGRGSSKAGGGIGVSGVSAVSGGSVLPVTKTLTPPTPQQVAQGNVLPAGGVPFSNFQSMTDDEKADVISDAIGVGLPAFLDDSALQRFAYYTGMSDKPTMISDSQFNNVKGLTIYRTVHDAYNPSTDIGYTANDIYKQISGGDFTMYSDSGGSAYGKAIYFADNFRASQVYMDSRHNNVMMRAKVTGNVGDYYKLQSQLSRDNSKLGRACKSVGISDGLGIYALAKGYDGLANGTSGTGNYVMMYNRKGLTMSDKTINPKGKSGWN